MTHKGLELIGGLLDIEGVSVGEVTCDESRTGVTALVLPPGSRGGVSVIGGAPATRETDVLRPENLVQGPDAILFTGGSAFGLRAADGAMEALSAAGRGVKVGGSRVPIVCAAALFDLRPGAPVAAPTAEDGRAAVEAALARASGAVAEGASGAGRGATVGKVWGPGFSMAAGQGAITLRTPDGLSVAALAVVNAVGSVLSAEGRVLAGPARPGMEPVDAFSLFAEGAQAPRPGEATCLVAVVVGGSLAKAGAARVAMMAHDGLARAISPAHTLYDGDVVFAVATGSKPCDVSRSGALAAKAVELAVRRSLASSGV